MNPLEQYAKEFMAKSGRENALRLAKQNMEATSPGVWNTLPVGGVYYRTVDNYKSLSNDERASMRTVTVRVGETADGKPIMGQKNYILRIRDLLKTHRFWQNVHGIINRRLNGKT